MDKDAELLERMGHHPAKHTLTERGTVAELCRAFERSPLPLAQRLQNFPRHVRRQDVARFLAKTELFKLVLDVHGSVVEGGVFAGGGLVGWLHLSAILEPYNHTRRVVGFDTFEGFRGVDTSDTEGGSSVHLRSGAFSTHVGIREELEGLVAVHDRNRPLGHLPKVELVAGNACATIPEYLRKHPHLVVSLLYLDFDLYGPTKAALETLFPRVPRGGVVAFDELACSEFPGETAAVMETLGLGTHRLRRFAFEPHISYLVKD